MSASQAVRTEVLRGTAEVSKGFCTRFIVEAQNADGAWGYRPNLQSCVEPTCWALLALGPTNRASDPGLEWLCSAQLPDGSWPAYRGQTQGCWTTALACLALHQLGGPPDQVQRGVLWLLSAWPAEYRWWWRLRSRFGRGFQAAKQNCALPGWSWVPGTASWVEPTSCAIILLRKLSATTPIAAAAKRMLLAEKMLRDRMCPGGGWSSGNPIVYGVATEPRVGPTAWALLALRNGSGRPDLQSSLDWLEHVCGSLRTPWSLALGYTTLTAYDRHTSALEESLRAIEAASSDSWNVPAAALMAMALGGGNALVHVGTGLPPRSVTGQEPRHYPEVSSIRREAA